jgi:hypothetical protein
VDISLNFAVIRQREWLYSHAPSDSPLLEGNHAATDSGCGDLRLVERDGR